MFRAIIFSIFRSTRLCGRRTIICVYSFDIFCSVFSVIRTFKSLISKWPHSTSICLPRHWLHSYFPNYLNSTQHSRLSEGQKIPRILWNSNINSHVQNNRHLFYPKPDTYTTRHAIYFLQNMSISFHLRLAQLSSLFLSSYPTKTLHKFLSHVYRMYITSHPH